MSILHIVNKSPFTHSTLQSCLAVCSNQDAVLLMEDGVYAALQTSELHSLTIQGLKVYVLSCDAEARAISQKISSSFQLINYEKFVQLTITHNCVQSWY